MRRCAGTGVQNQEGITCAPPRMHPQAQERQGALLGPPLLPFCHPFHGGLTALKKGSGQATPIMPHLHCQHISAPDHCITAVVSSIPGGHSGPLTV